MRRVSGADSSTRLKLGYKYSRYLAVESEFVDAARHSGDLFASPGNLSSAFRSSGYTVDTIAMLPVWRFSFYGRMGAYRGEPNLDDDDETYGEGHDPDEV